MPVLVAELHDRVGDEVVVVAPDAGRVKVAERFSQQLIPGAAPGECEIT